MSLLELYHTVVSFEKHKHHYRASVYFFRGTNLHEEYKVLMYSDVEIYLQTNKNDSFTWQRKSPYEIHCQIHSNGVIYILLIFVSFFASSANFYIRKAILLMVSFS